MWSAVQPASLPGPSKPTKYHPTISRLAAPPLSATELNSTSTFLSSAVQPVHGSWSPPNSSAVQPAHRSSRIEKQRISALNLEAACAKIKDIQPTKINWINLRSQQTQKDRHGAINKRSELTREFKRSLVLVKRQMESSNLSLAQKRERRWDKFGNTAVVNRIIAGERQQTQQQTHHQESHDNGAAMEDGSTDMEHGLCLRTNFGNLGERQWFVHRMLQLSGTPTHRCPHCINRLAWTCKQIHIWFYTTFEARKLEDTEDSSSSESISTSTRKTPPSSDADKHDERQQAMSERGEETSSTLRRATKTQRRNQRRRQVERRWQQRRNQEAEAVYSQCTTAC